MKKTTWVIIGLSFCVVALSIALAVVITMKKTEPAFSTELYDFSNVRFAPKPWLPGYSFSIKSNYTKTKSYYYGSNGFLYPRSEFDKRGDFLGKSIPGLQGVIAFTERPIQKRRDQTKEEKN